MTSARAADERAPWPRSASGPLLIRTRRVAVDPGRLCVETWHTHAAAVTPRARNCADRTTEMGEDLAAAATGHALPRPAGRPGLTLAVAIVARHEAIRLAFCT